MADPGTPGAASEGLDACRRAGWPDVIAKRVAWLVRFAAVRAAGLVFVHEFGSNTKMQWAHRRAAPGERVVAAVPHGLHKSISTAAALSARGVVASVSYDAGTTAARFVAFVRDDLSAHNARRVDELVTTAGYEAVRLPLYSPDLMSDQEHDRQGQSGLVDARPADGPALLEAIPAVPGDGHPRRRDQIPPALRVRYDVTESALNLAPELVRRGFSQFEDFDAYVPSASEGTSRDVLATDTHDHIMCRLACIRISASLVHGTTEGFQQGPRAS